ncbi:uncharacterized protein EMH_0091080 [Eimeria mitis]|uniref:Uncharacterized protein n=1 Tax=Eimeria mitis TaxID=44415 RepID=U6KCQ2_9EIME|nr:uncharacterized protein EMH_0091080 [Eimeria mitis]CDJ34566.1 hypothetical protein, conserved [Eimeria mitis]
MWNHALHTRARRLSAGEGRKRGFESLCESDSDEVSAWLDSDSDHDASASTVPPAKQPRTGQEPHESSSLPVAQQQAISPQMASSASALPGTHPLRGWTIDFSDRAHWVVSDNFKEIQAAEALLQLSTSTSSVEAAGGGAREQDNTKLMRKFNPRIAGCECWATAKPTALLCSAHDHLAKPSLTPEELEKLTYDAERLSAFLAYDIPPEEDTPLLIVAEYLGLRFLIMDVIVATLQLLGEPASGTWWERATGNIRLEFPCQREMILHLRVKTHYDKTLCRHLTAALRVLVSGRRPSEEDLLKIKRMLFCSHHSPRRFRGILFEKWRRDEEEFHNHKDPA